MNRFFGLAIICGVIFIAGCSSESDQSSQQASASVATASPDPTATPTPEPCSKAAEDAERNVLVQNYTYDSTDAMEAGRIMMNNEIDCATDSKDPASISHHYTMAAMGYLFMAVHGPDMFGSKKNDLEGAIQAAGSALEIGGMSDDDQKLASDEKQSAQEKLDALTGSDSSASQ